MNQTRPMTPAPTIATQLCAAADLLALVSTIFHRELAEECTVAFGAARYLTAQCADASDTLIELASGLDHASDKETTP